MNSFATSSASACAAFDANVAAAAVMLRGEAWAGLVKMARRQVFAHGTAFTIEETRGTAAEWIRHREAKHNAAGAVLPPPSLIEAACATQNRRRPQ